jgi:GNAT superfamily N-acetyltransferase
MRSKAVASAFHQLTFHPLTPDRWPDLERLFGPNGACSGCWCMWWRMRGPDFRRAEGAEKKRAFSRVCRESDIPPGVIAYREGAPIGWVAVAPRANYIRLAEARVLKPIDDKPVWSITCFFIHRNARRTGMMEKLIGAAVDFARAHGARIVEAYPRPVTGKMSSGDLYVRTLACFERAGFEVAARPSEARAVVRKAVSASRAKTPSSAAAR